MAIILGDNRYGKAENRIVRITRDAPRHEIRDLNVSTSLRGDFAVEPGAVEWFVGLDSSDRAAQGAFEVVGERRPVASAERVFFSTVSHDRP